jgi:hypothetical protein
MKVFWHHLLVWYSEWYLHWVLVWVSRFTTDGNSLWLFWLYCPSLQSPQCFKCVFCKGTIKLICRLLFESSWDDRATSKIREQYEKSAEMVIEATDNIRTVSMLTMQEHVSAKFFGKL